MSASKDWGKAVFLKPLPVIKLVEIDWGVHTCSGRKDTKPRQMVLPSSGLGGSSQLQFTLKIPTAALLLSCGSGQLSAFSHSSIPLLQDQENTKLTKSQFQHFYAAPCGQQ